MKIIKSKIIFLYLTSFIIFISVFLCSGTSAQTTAVNSATESAMQWTTTEKQSSNDSKIIIPRWDFDICDENDTLSSDYCSCNKLVISCDFSQYTHPEKAIISVRGQLINTSVKRLCICNSPRNLMLILANGFLPTGTINQTIHRVDIFNIQGPLQFNEAFSRNFAGDLYLSKIAYLERINSWEFQRGNDMLIENVEGLECCSQIKVLQEFKKPTLYFENTTIGRINSNGINSIHLWKTIILKRVQVLKGINKVGVILKSENLNVSITECNFNNVADDGIVLEKFENLLIAKTLITNSSAAALEVRSNISNSSLVIVDNFFNNSMVWRMDAHRIINWFNLYNFWDKWTFANSSDSDTSFIDRIVSVEYNTVMEHWFNETSDSVLPSKSIVFNENVIGRCNCTYLLTMVLPNFLKVNPNRCDYSKMHDMNGICLIDIKTAISRCQKEQNKTNFSEMCKDSTVAVSSYHANAFKDVKIKAPAEIKINSPFIAKMMKGLKFMFHTHQVIRHPEAEEEKYSTSGQTDSNTSTSTTTNHSLTFLYVLLGLIGVVLTVSASVIVYKRGRRNAFRSQGLSESYDVLTTST